MKFNANGNAILNEDGKGIVINGNTFDVDDTIIGGQSIEPILELGTNTDNDAIINLKYEKDGAVLNSPVAFKKDEVVLENNHLSIKAVNGIKLGKEGEKEGFYKSDGTFTPFKSGKLSVELLKKYYDNTKTAHTIDIENINNYDMLVFSFNEVSSPEGDWFFTGTSNNNTVFLLTTCKALKDQTDGITAYSTYQTSSFSLNVKYISDTQLELIKSNAAVRNWLVYGIKVN